MNDITLERLLGRVADNIKSAREAIARGRRDLADTNIKCAHSLVDYIELRRNTPDREIPTSEPAPTAIENPSVNESNVHA